MRFSLVADYDSYPIICTSLDIFFLSSIIKLEAISKLAVHLRRQRKNVLKVL